MLKTIDREEFLRQVKFDAQGLVPAIIQDAANGEVLMMAYMNGESLAKTLESGRTWFYSRSRQQLWLKGATSGHFQDVREIFYDCDADTLLIKVIQHGVACHEGERSCFHHRVSWEAVEQPVDQRPEWRYIINDLYDLILERKNKRPEGSYTTYLFEKGLDKILKKVGEETAEVIIASKNRSQDEITYEVADLFYHLIVLLGYHEVSPDQILQELVRRR